jgi:flagellar hook-associated protein FlgK
MNPLASIASSGMNAARTQLSASANNIANAQTPGYQRQDVVQQADPAGGVSASTVRSSGEQNTLVHDVVQQLQAKNAFLANLAVFRSNTQMMGTLVNLHA